MASADEGVLTLSIGVRISPEPGPWSSSEDIMWPLTMS